MPGVPLFLIFSTFQAETVQIETTFVLPPLGEAVISEIELRLPHQIPDLIPKETKKGHTEDISQRSQQEALFPLPGQAPC